MNDCFVKDFKQKQVRTSGLLNPGIWIRFFDKAREFPLTSWTKY